MYVSLWIVYNWSGTNYFKQARDSVNEECCYYYANTEANYNLNKINFFVYATKGMLRN